MLILERGGKEIVFQVANLIKFILLLKLILTVKLTLKRHIFVTNIEILQLMLTLK